MERVVATLLPNNTYKKMVFDPWKQTSYDVNDTVADTVSKPEIHALIMKSTALWRNTFTLNDPNWKTWFEERQYQTTPLEEQDAATKAARVPITPTTAYLDTLGRAGSYYCTTITVLKSKTITALPS